MVKYELEYLSGEGMSEEDILKALCDKEDSIFDRTEISIKEIE